jgi:hypothetical protein
MQLGKGRGTAVCSNGHTAVDAQHTRIIAHDGTTETGDRAGRSPMALEATAVLGSGGDAVAEVGDDHGEAVQTCLAAGIPPSVARPLTSAKQNLGLCSTEDCPSDGATDPSQCPAGARRTFRCATVDLGRPLRSEATAAGSACALKPQGTRHTGGRRLTRWVEEHWLDEMAQRGRRRPEGMTQRTQWVEHPCGTMQRG